jgi:predicted AlkP superfamily pyrophosphatase or phosphodiesterase
MPTVFVLVDALGWDLIRERDFLNDLLPYRTEVKTVFGFSSGEIPSILTGLLPRDHEHWNLFVYDPPKSPFRWAKGLNALPRSWSNSRVVRKAVSMIGRKVSRTDGYFQIYGVPVELLPFFDVCEKNDLYGPGGMSPKASIFDRLETEDIPYRVYSYHHYKDEEAVNRVVDDLRQDAAEVYFVYLSELDAFLHLNVDRPDAVSAELERYAASLRRIYDAAAGRDSDSGFFVFSDHGMTETRETFDLQGAVASLGWRVPEDYIALYDSTMARFWFFDPGARREIEAVLRGLDSGSVVSKEEESKFGIDFGPNRFGDLIFLMKQACLIHPSHMGRVPWKGMHGFHPDDPSSSASLLARSKPTVPVHGVWDLFHLMCAEAGIR